MELELVEVGNLNFMNNIYNRDLEQLKKDIEEIRQRNSEVENSKSWETSKTRKILLMLFTYLALGIYMNAIKVERPWLNSFIPTLGFLLSTLSLPFFKKILLRKENIFFGILMILIIY